MSYKINELYIENFKSIENAHLIFNEQNLTVLDGPNGFGKTSIFDAIELVLTGNIRRISDMKIVDGNKGYDDYLFAKNQELPIIVKVGLFNEEDQTNIVLGRKIEHRNLSRRQKKPGEFPSTLHNLQSINEELTTHNQSELIVNELFNTEDFSNSYGLFHYVEQEECTHLFKKTENDRMSAISKLFNIEKEEFERGKLLKIKNRISANKNKLLKTINNLEKDLDLKAVNQDNDKKVEHVQILPDRVNNKFLWDSKELKPFNLEEKSKYLEQIDNLDYLLTNLNLFKAAYKNEQINKSINNRGRIEEVLILYHFHDSINGLKQEFQTKQSFNGYLSLLEERDILNPKINWEKINEHFELPILLDKLKDKLTIIDKLKKNSSQLSGMITNLLNTREKLKNQFEELIKNEEHKSEKCPLCGAQWEKYEELLTQIAEQTKFYENQQDQSSKEEISQTDDLYKNVIDELIQNMKLYISSLISDELYTSLKPYLDKKVNPIKVKTFFDELNINIEKYVYNQLDNLHQLSSKTDRVINELRESLKDTSDFDYEIYQELKDIYVNVFEKDDNLLLDVDVKRFNDKKDYINYIYVIQSNAQYLKYTNLKSKYEVINNAYNSVSETLKIYNNKIESYRSEMIKEIEIPFYIYSGKIIQNYQRGIGIFIKEDEGNGEQIKNIRFVPPQKTDHDIVHTFSSGQLSATVLAFTLALNKVYNNSGLNTILIDDPIQTMDELNMASFVELLRNEFGEQQIILSTHENQISLYVRYKFSKYGFKTQKLNVKELLYK